MLASAMSTVSLDALLVRMLVTAFVVVAVSWSVGALGPRIGGALAGLPIILGPGFYFLAMQSPAPFVSQAASYALLSLCATQLFLLAYVATARRGIPLLSIACAIFTWLMAAVVFQLLPARPAMGMALFILTTGICLRLSARFVSPAPSTTGKAGLGLLTVRGILAGALVALVTTMSQWLGSTGSGLLLAFPIGYTVISVTIHQKSGTASVVATLRSALLGTASLAGFCAALALAIAHTTPAAALATALSTSVLMTLGLIFRQRLGSVRRRQ